MEQIPEPFLRQVQIDPVFLGPGDIVDVFHQPPLLSSQDEAFEALVYAMRKLIDIATSNIPPIEVDTSGFDDQVVATGFF